MRGAPGDYLELAAAVHDVLCRTAGESALDAGSATVAAAYACDGGRAPARHRDRRRQNVADAMLRLALRAHLRLAQRLTGGQRTTYDAVKAVENYLQRDLPLQRAAAQRRRPARSLPVRGQDRVLPAVLRRDGADAANGGDPGARGGRVLARLATTATAASTAYATSTPTPGSRSISTGSAGCRSTHSHGRARGVAVQRPRRHERRRADAGEVRSGTAPPTSSERPTATGAGQRGRGGGPGLVVARDAAWPRYRLGAWRWSVRAAALAVGDVAEAQLAELRRALERLGFPCRPPRPCSGSSAPRPEVGPASARYAAALRAHRFDPRAPDAPGPSERRALRRELRPGGPLARLRGLPAIPPGGPRPL